MNATPLGTPPAGSFRNRNRPWLQAIRASARRALSWKRLAWAAVLGPLAAALVVAQTLHLNFYWSGWRIVYQVPWYTAFALVFLVAIAFAESPGEDGDHAPLSRYVAAALAASAVCLALAYAFSDLLVMAPRRAVDAGFNGRKVYLASDKRPSAVFALGFDGVLHGWLATFIYVHLRRQRLAARALARAQLERAEATRRLLDARLQAAHAQVDTDRVFRALDDIEQAYEQDPARADELLGELTEYLRAAIPGVREDAVTREAPDDEPESRRR